MARKKKSSSGSALIAVAYYRMSSDKQDKSIASQRAEVDAYAKANGYRITREYCDEGISGAESERRDGFQRLIRDAQDRGDFQLILCWDQDRFSRFDPLEANHYWFLLKQASVAIETVAQGRLDFSDLAGWLVASVNQAGKSQYLRDLARNSARGRRNAAQRGEWPGKSPFGYAKREGRLVLGDQEAVGAVKLIFERYAAADVSLRQLADELNAKGIAAPAGGLWASHKIRNLITRPAYRGEAIFNRIARSKLYRSEEERPADEWIVHKCPAIVSVAVWKQAQKRLKERRVRTTPHRDGGEYLLSGLLHCADCGGRMIGMKRRGGRWAGYYCGTYAQYGKRFCNCNSIGQSELLDLLIPRITNDLLSPDVFELVREEVADQLEAEQRTRPNESQYLRRKIGKLDNEIKEAAAELKRTPDDLYPLSVEHLRELRSARDQIADRLRGIEAADQQPQESDVDGVMACVEELRNRIESTDAAVVRSTFHELVERVDLEFQHRDTQFGKRREFKRGLIRWKLTDLLHQAPKSA